MDFEEKLRYLENKSKQSSSVKRISFFHLDWKGKVKLAIPLSIYLMIAALVVKIIYEVVFGQDTRGIFSAGGTSAGGRHHHQQHDSEDMICF